MFYDIKFPIRFLTPGVSGKLAIERFIELSYIN